MKKPKSQKLADAIDGAVVLITGGTGSFGNAVLDRLMTTGVKEVRVFSRDEKKQYDMYQRYRGQPVRFYVGDVRDKNSITRACVGVDYVFHAAALKQVPTGEFFPMEVVQTNVIGSANTIEAAIAAGVKTMVCLTTDKAVMPVNAMGMTKALMEKIAQSYARLQDASKTKLSCVRYGNVMYSRGSVIPLFLEQMRRGEPMTITHPEMTRFMLPLADATSLVLSALTHGGTGDVWIKKSPSCNLRQLAKVLANLVGQPCKTKEIGIRQGEKMDETLATASEMARAEDYGDHLRIPMDTTDLTYSKYFTEGGEMAADLTSRTTHLLTDDELEQLLRSLPELMREIKDGIVTSAA